VRKLIIFSLLATSAAPLIARPDDDSQDRRAERRARVEAQVSKDSVPPHNGRSIERRPRFDRQSAGRGSFEPREINVDMERSPGFSRERLNRARAEGRQDERLSPTDRQPSRRGRESGVEEQADSVRDWRGPAMVRPPRGIAEPGVPSERRERLERRAGSGEWDARRRSRTGSTIPREGTQPPIAAVQPDEHRRRLEWRHDWRNDRRYDWRRHRDRHRSIFHVGIYYDPFGWNYRRYNVGWRLWPDYYRSNYWIHDPWMYRLPTTYPGTRWIRYHNDALLVDTWSGEVIDVIYGFFW
jgi:Ni/Co efflux regulator RcnB